MIESLQAENVQNQQLIASLQEEANFKEKSEESLRQYSSEIEQLKLLNEVLISEKKAESKATVTELEATVTELKTKVSVYVAQGKKEVQALTQERRELEDIDYI